MLIQAISDICENLKVAFYFGSQNEFNAMATSHTTQMGTAVFCEGYLNESWSLDGQGAFDETSNITLWVLQISALSDEQDTRLPVVYECKVVAKEILYRLKEYYELGPVTVGGIKNFTDTNFDGVRITGTGKELYNATYSPC